MKFRLLAFLILSTHLYVFSWGDKEPELTSLEIHKRHADRFLFESQFKEGHVFEDEDEENSDYERSNEPQIDKTKPLIVKELKFNNKADIKYEDILPGYFALKNGYIIASSYLNNKSPLKKLESEWLSHKIANRSIKDFEKIHNKENVTEMDYELMDFQLGEEKITDYSILKNKRNKRIPYFCIEDINTVKKEFPGISQDITVLDECGVVIFLVYINDYFIGCIATKEAGKRAEYTLISHKEIDKTAKEKILKFIDNLER